MNTLLVCIFGILINARQLWCIRQPNNYLSAYKKNNYYSTGGNYFKRFDNSNYTSGLTKNIVPLNQYVISSVSIQVKLFIITVEPQQNEDKNHKMFAFIQFMPPDGIFLTSARWSTQENVLYFADKYGEQFYRYNSSSNNLTIVDVGFGPTGMILPVQDAPGITLVAGRAALYLMVWGVLEFDKQFTSLASVDIDKPNSVISTGTVDVSGKLWFGTMGKVTGGNIAPDQATVYYMNNRNIVNPIIKIRPVVETSGITFSIDNKKLFFNDGPRRKIVAYDFVLETGKIANKTVLLDFNDFRLPGLPLDMTIDADNNLWVATYNGSRILKIDSNNGDILDDIPLPVDQVTSLAWGGPDLCTLYVTTGKYLARSPKRLSGRLFTITNTGTKGLPPQAFYLPNAKQLSGSEL